ncbi:hypothetical protein [Shinella sumterensis]|jgi:hypothetical protein|uniref:Uncharacterized protein n=1 Tax=Shinella sumterensis TaxID=1967501 RepID=A0AA50CW51_9HYPH|nr:hypothetical protein [Shinella sumterensis]TXH84917.1 MAG: hypothetical protein E6Q77_01560 [Rhizobium sp.]WLS01382.1 hypothetical protein Q9313_28710 [Shinella sumterensis]
MRIVVEKSNLAGAVNWLRQNDEAFTQLDDDAATEKLTSFVQRKFRDLSIEDADTDKVHEIVWRGVMGVVAGGGARHLANDQREVILYIGASAGGNRGLIELD